MLATVAWWWSKSKSHVSFTCQKLVTPVPTNNILTVIFLGISHLTRLLRSTQLLPSMKNAAFSWSRSLPNSALWPQGHYRVKMRRTCWTCRRMLSMSRMFHRKPKNNSIVLSSQKMSKPWCSMNICASGRGTTWSSRWWSCWFLSIMATTKASLRLYWTTWRVFWKF